MNRARRPNTEGTRVPKSISRRRSGVACILEAQPRVKIVTTGASWLDQVKHDDYTHLHTHIYTQDQRNESRIQPCRVLTRRADRVEVTDFEAWPKFKFENENNQHGVA